MKTQHDVHNSITSIYIGGGLRSRSKQLIKGRRRLYKKDGESVIYLAGGCFWGLESYVVAIPWRYGRRIRLCKRQEQQKVTYEEVCRGGAGYKETVRVVYNPKQLSLETLLFAFFKAIDPSVTNRQGNVVGEQYQTGVFCTDEESEKI